MKLLYVLAIGGGVVGILILPAFLYGQQETTGVAVPTDSRSAGEFLQGIVVQLPQAIGKIWQDTVLPFWKNLFREIGERWSQYVAKPLGWIWAKITNIFSGEIEKRQPIIEKGLQEEKQEVEREFKEKIAPKVPEARQGLWERFKSLFRD